jgi:hypothetical protein
LRRGYFDARAVQKDRKRTAKPSFREPKRLEGIDLTDKKRKISHQAGIAQLVEQRIRNAKVVGSTPITGTI